MVAPDTARIPLTRGLFALVSEADFAELSQYRWYARPRGNQFYAIRRERTGDSRNISVSMHRQILGAPAHLVVDHRNGDTLDNRRANLRICTPMQNSRNKRVICATSGFKGVHIHLDVWRANIHVAGKKIFLGLFEDPIEAARAYDAAALTHFGEFAATNQALGLLPAARADL